MQGIIKGRYQESFFLSVFLNVVKNLLPQCFVAEDSSLNIGVHWDLFLLQFAEGKMPVK